MIAEIDEFSVYDEMLTDDWLIRMFVMQVDSGNTPKSRDNTYEYVY